MLRGFPLGNSIITRIKYKVKEAIIITKTKREIQKAYEQRTNYAAQKKYATKNYDDLKIRVKK